MSVNKTLHIVVAVLLALLAFNALQASPIPGKRAGSL